MRRERPGHVPAPWTTGVAAIARRVEQAQMLRLQATQPIPSSIAAHPKAQPPDEVAS
jgi:hypothetical protein